MAAKNEYELWDFFAHYRLCMITLCAYFTLTRFLYCYVHTYGYERIIFVEFISSSVFLVLSYLVLINKTIRMDGVYIGALFIVTAYASRFISDGYMGIIDFVWLPVLGIILGVIIFSYQFEIFRTRDIKRGCKMSYYTQYSIEVQLLLNKTIESLVNIGMGLALAMTILWAGEVWRKIEEIGVQEYARTLKHSAAMASAYFIIFIAVGFWVVIPLYRKLSILKDHMK